MIIERPNQSKQSGSVIVWILIAVGLIAALSYAFTSSSRNSTALITTAQADAKADEIIAFGNDVKTAIRRMRLNGVDISEIDFSHPTILRYLSTPSPFPANPNCNSNKCLVFHPEGGGLTPKLFEDIATPHVLTFSTGRPQAGHPWLFRTNVLNVSTTAHDLTLHIERLPSQICGAINKRLSLDFDHELTDEGFGSKGEHIYYDIDAPLTPTASNILGDGIAELDGQKSGCYDENDNLKYAFYLVIEPR